MRVRHVSIIGIVVVFGAAIGGYLVEKEKMLVLIQPAPRLYFPADRRAIS